MYLVKNVGATLYTQDDITSLSLNPHFARPTSSGVEQDLTNERNKASGAGQKQQDRSVLALTKLQGILRCRELGLEKNAPIIDQGEGDNWGRFPSALLCEVCKSLMREPCLTPCCQFNGCFSCI